MEGRDTFVNHFITENGTEFMVEASKVTLERCRNLLLVGVYATNREISTARLGMRTK
jgi:hypothetical protein